MSRTGTEDFAANHLPQAARSGTGEDERLIRAMEEYRARLEAGEKPDRHAFLLRHPDIAEALAGCLTGLDFLHAVAPNLSQPGRDNPAASTGAGEDRPGATLGDFRIVREVGRGGMGVVYEAEQVSLGRRVALKVLPFAATMDPRQLQRFQNEARAAASLHHEHIVPVYFVGQERGVHFYAMQFVDGHSLAAFIHLRRDQPAPAAPAVFPPTGPTTAAEPEAEGERVAAGETVAAAVSTQPAPQDRAYFEFVARLGIQAAEALEHAHSLGIVHRDVKPANLMVDGR